jgi:hypothetical protein
MRVIDISNQTFGRWTVLSRAENTTQGQTQWLCRCECGTERIVVSILLRRGITRSCGCLKQDRSVRDAKHGHAHSGAITPTYWSWAGMIARCDNPKHRSYADYGGSGITVCERWHTFANFLADMGEKPEGCSIDRIDNAKGYLRDNCRWSTAKDQARNKRSNRMIEYDGKTRTIAEWAEILHIPQHTISDRLRHGATIAQALSVTPLQYGEMSRNG